jgi:translation elongation factor EF-1alpha
MENEEGKKIGIVSNFFDQVSVAAIKLDAELNVGDTIRFVGGETDFEQTVNSMQVQKDSIESAKKGDEIGLKVKERVRKGYKVFKI